MDCDPCVFCKYYMKICKQNIQTHIWFYFIVKKEERKIYKVIQMRVWGVITWVVKFNEIILDINWNIFNKNKR